MAKQSYLFKYYGYSYCQGTKDTTRGYISVITKDPHDHVVKDKIIDFLRNSMGVIVENYYDIDLVTIEV